jgi:cytolysin-activating lysine-acyltransferase
MMTIGPYEGIGYALELLAKSDYHRQHRLGAYLRVEILPPLLHGQARFYLTEDGIPTALVTWAWLSAEVEQDVHATGRALTRQEWRCGDRLFFNDGIAPHGNVRDLLHDMQHSLFPEATHATSLRRNPDGSIRRVHHWRRSGRGRIRQDAVTQDETGLNGSGRQIGGPPRPRDPARTAGKGFRAAQHGQAGRG